MLPNGKVKRYLEATEILPYCLWPSCYVSQTIVKSYSFVEYDGILKVQYQKVSITLGVEGFELMKLSDLMK